jgi:MCM P-loop domain
MRRTTLETSLPTSSSRPDLYQPMMKTPDKCSNKNCDSNKKKVHALLFPRREYINAVVIELRDTSTFSDIDPLKVMIFDEDTIDVHNHLGQKVTITGSIRVITFPRKDSVSYLYAETISYESNQEVIITAYDKAAIEKLVLVAKRRKMSVLNILGSMFAPEIISNNIIKQGMLLCAASTNADETQKKIQILIIGDPGLGKSMILRKSVELVPNSRYESAENSSGKSLTAIVEKDDESHILRTGPVPASKGAICALNELGRMYFEDQKHLLSVMQEQYFTINKHGISASIHSPTAIIASANPIDGEWKYSGFPRTISTKTTEGRQIVVYNKDGALVMFKAASYLDCKINAYPKYVEWKGINRQPPNFIFIDLDQGRFKLIDRVLDKTLDNICQKFNTVVCPTVIWSGHGYHIYLPFEAFVLEEESEFARFGYPSRKFLQFSEEFLSDKRADTCHTKGLSFKNCMLRIPGSFNSKYRMKEEEVKIVQRWDGIRPNIKPLLFRFDLYLLVSKSKELHRRTKHRKMDRYVPKIFSTDWRTR